MEEKDEALIRTLLEREPELRHYYEEHVDLERRLGAFQQKLYLTPEEEMEKKRLQKLKLAGKDRIMEILSRYRSHWAPHAPRHLHPGRERVRRAGARGRPVQRPRLQHREPVGGRDARPDRVAHHAGHAGRR